MNLGPVVGVTSFLKGGELNPFGESGHLGV